MSYINPLKKKFLDQTPPPNYVAGLGRGAIGFTTRSDIGSARNVDGGVPGFGDRKQQQQQRSGNEDDENGDDSDNIGYTNYDEFNGDANDGFSDPNAIYDADDKEADDIWAELDRKMDSRRKTRREEKEREQMEMDRMSRPKIQQQLAEYKLGLAAVSLDEWMNLPDGGDISRKAVKKQREIYVPVPDSLIERARQENESYSVLQVGNSSGGINDGNLSSISGTTTTDLTQVGSARKTVLDLKLNQVSDSVSGQTCVDPKGYLTDLKSKKIATDTEIGDIKKARLLFKSVIQTNPKHAPGWIAAAKLEMLAGKLSQARKIISQGCQECPDNEEVWIENANLQTPDNAKAVLAQAVKLIPQSVKVWLYATNLEKDIRMKKKILRRALEFIPTSVKLWKEAIELEEPDDARIMLGRAVECVSDNVELWLALANLETYEKAREVLNRARQSIPTSSEIWIAAAQLEESAKKNENVSRVIKKAIKSLSTTNIVVMDREKWIGEAEKSEKVGYPITCQAIIFESIGMGVEEEDRKRVWCADAEELIQRGSIKTASAVYAYLLTVFPTKKSVWVKVAQLEKQYGSKESLEQTLKQAIKNCPHYEVLWLMYAKEKWLAGDVDQARSILTQAFESNPGSEEIWLAAVKIESEMNEIKVARGLLKRAIDMAATERIWMKSALLEREFGESKAENDILAEGLKAFPTSWKLWLMKAQLEERVNPRALDKIRDIYNSAVTKCPSSIPLWLEFVRFEKRANNQQKARTLLEKAKLRNPKNEEIYLEFVRFEKSVGNAKAAANWLSVGLQECPKSGLLWAEAIANEPKHGQKNKCVDALNKCNNDQYVLTQVAKIFWFDGKLDKAKSWFKRAITTFSDYGDAWAYYYLFLLRTGQSSSNTSKNLNESEMNELLKQCLEAEPHHGEQWTKVSKQRAPIRLFCHCKYRFTK
ncbi:TPR repeat-containing protein [Heterostelium album PN500]|uniref:TPR repeat-containing protein n=1 Tax=Heterostelium pallidum (strain ATCC 26659 / Pp 5 / PN500) TaxID=670386 RepID=D3B3X9_HETP5|nr:TPR repeat-containing protein [Heterostelium album PN500]EFA84027.1 TPR repeat-containing protein [Heterostelium album PN500]|eukprot:XP_020436144.1 TPR repeat-containing protein [Heterostelium album PN500]